MTSALVSPTIRQLYRNILIILKFKGIICQRTRSSTGQSVCLRNRRLEVRVLPGAQKMNKTIIVVAVLALIVTGFIAFSRESVESPVTSPTPKASQIAEIPSDWSSYTSPRFGYTLSYPKEWFFVPFDEANSEILQGSHTLLNYNYNGIEAYMNHGMVDWQKFLGEQVAIKIDLFAERVEEVDREAFINKYYSEASRASESDLIIGELETIQLNTADSISGELIRSYVAFTDSTAISLNLFAYNLPSQVVLGDTNEWQELAKILSAFR